MLLTFSMPFNGNIIWVGWIKKQNGPHPAPGPLFARACSTHTEQGCLKKKEYVEHQPEHSVFLHKVNCFLPTNETPAYQRGCSTDDLPGPGRLPLPFPCSIQYFPLLRLSHSLFAFLSAPFPSTVPSFPRALSCLHPFIRPAPKRILVRMRGGERVIGEVGILGLLFFLFFSSFFSFLRCTHNTCACALMHIQHTSGYIYTSKTGQIGECLTDPPERRR